MREKEGVGEPGLLATMKKTDQKMGINSEMKQLLASYEKEHYL